MAGLVAVAALPFFAVHLPPLWEAGCALGQLAAVGLLALCALPVRSRLGIPATALSLTRHRDLGVLVLALALVVPGISAETWRPAMFRTVPLFLLFGIILRDTIKYRGTVEPASQATLGTCQIPRTQSRNVMV